MRTTKAHLEGQIKVLNKMTEDKFQFDLDWAYGGVRVTRAKGRADVTSRETKTEISRELCAMIHILTLIKRG